MSYLPQLLKSLIVLSATALGCAAHAPQDGRSGTAGVGQLNLNLETAGTSGAVYRLHGEFEVLNLSTGEFKLFVTDEDSDAALREELSVGSYAMLLRDNWRIQRIGVGDNASNHVVFDKFGQEKPAICAERSELEICSPGFGFGYIPEVVPQFVNATIEDDPGQFFTIREGGTAIVEYLFSVGTVPVGQQTGDFGVDLIVFEDESLNPSDPVSDDGGVAGAPGFEEGGAASAPGIEDGDDGVAGAPGFEEGGAASAPGIEDGDDGVAGAPGF